MPSTALTANEVALNNSESPNDYFNSYDCINVHNLMLRDEPRVTKYRDAILQSKNLFKDKIVLDVGSGTGLLSLFSAQAGAKHVYAVEASKGICELSKAIIEANNLQDKITVINSVIEEVNLPVDSVDIIVSEWMGFYLLHESMLNSVLFARDKWLRKDGNGLMYPSLAYLYVCPVELTSYLNENLKYWSNYYNLSYEPMQRVYKQLMLEKPLVENLQKDQLIDDEKILMSFDLNTIDIRELESIQAYNLEFNANRSCCLHGFAFWFDVIFKTDDDVITLSTRPGEMPTHWKQTIAVLPASIDAFISSLRTDVINDEKVSDLSTLNENDAFECFVIMNQSDMNPRNYEIDIGVDMAKNDQEAIDDDEQIEEDDVNDDDHEHPMPCDCGRIKCVLIKATLEKYDKEGQKE